MTTADLNGHTYFLREVAVLEAVVEHLRGLGRRPRVWSVGCAGGEEVFSLAMLGLEAGVAMEILGTDVRRAAIEEAKQARYRPKALRFVDPGRRLRWFDERDGLFVVKEQVRRLTSFRRHDLLGDPPMIATGRGWDLVICRNVLLYFHEREALDSIRRLTSVLGPNGILVLGAAERLPADHRRSLAMCRLGGGIAYTAGSLPTSRPRREPVVDVSRLSDELLNTGSVEDALAEYRAALVQEPERADLHLRTGVSCLLLDRRDEARDSLRRSLFLDPMLWPAAVLLADLVGDDPRAEAQYLRAALAGLTAKRQVDGAVEAHRITLDAVTRRLALLAAQRGSIDEV